MNLRHGCFSNLVALCDPWRALSVPTCRVLPSLPARPPGQVHTTARREAIRFVFACPDGHLDDVNWNAVVPHRPPACQPAHYLWIGGGAALRFVSIECPNCGGVDQSRHRVRA